MAEKLIAVSAAYVHGIMFGEAVNDNTIWEDVEII